MKAKEVRGMFAVQLDRLMKVAPIATMGLMVANLSILLSQAVGWRGGPAWVWVLGSGTLIALVVLVFAHVWFHQLDMVRAMRKAAAFHDPCQVYQITPWERVVWIHALIPQMEAQAKVAEKMGVDVQGFRQQIDRLKKWESLGYIPRSEYPPHLLRYYWHTEDEL